MKFGNIRIGNKRKGAIRPTPNELIIDVDRCNPVLGNKYILEDHRDDIKRAEVINNYKLDFEKDCAENGPMLEETKRIARKVYKGQDIVLQCWCAGKPTYKPCHADFIKKKIEEILEPYKDK